MFSNNRLHRIADKSGSRCAGALNPWRSMTSNDTDFVRDQLLGLASIIDSHPDWWRFPTEGLVQGFLGDDPLFIVGDQPSTSSWNESHPNRRAFYDTLPRVGAARAHLTDLYKRRGRAGELGAEIPPDFEEHLAFFRRELEILQPKRVVALGNAAYGLLIRFIPELRGMLSRMWHFSYVVRARRVPEYEANIQNALAGRKREIPPLAQPGCATTYSHSRLCFKAKEIEPLGMEDKFCVVTGVGTFVMTKREFYSTFPKVAASDSYRYGKKEYHYPRTPQRALRFQV
jgi:hypothetical protein